MSLDALVWAVKEAPVSDVETRAVLTTMADPADEDGCGSLLSTSTIAERTRLSTRTVQRCIDDMLERRVIVLGDQARAAYIRADRRPVVYDLMIPHSSYGKARLEQINKERATKKLPPLTAESRPDLPPAPPKKRRADVGKPRPKKGGVTTSHPVEDPDEMDGATTSHPVENPDEMDGVTSSQAVDGVTTGTGRLVNADGVTINSPRGDYKSPEPVIDPGVEPEVQNPPLPLGEEVTVAREAEPQGGEGKLSGATPALAAIVAEVREVRPLWTADLIAQAATTCLESGRNPTEIRKALFDAAHDPDSRLPNRINNPTWWAMTQAPPAPAAAANEPSCPTHPGYPLRNCTGCKVDTEVEEVERARAAKAAAAATARAAQLADEPPPARSLARQIAAAKGRKGGGPGPSALAELIPELEVSA